MLLTPCFKVAVFKSLFKTDFRKRFSSIMKIHSSYVLYCFSTDANTQPQSLQLYLSTHHQQFYELVDIQIEIIVLKSTFADLLQSQKKITHSFLLCQGLQPVLSFVITVMQFGVVEVPIIAGPYLKLFEELLSYSNIYHGAFWVSTTLFDAIIIETLPNHRDIKKHSYAYTRDNAYPASLSYPTDYSHPAAI